MYMKNTGTIHWYYIGGGNQLEYGHCAYLENWGGCHLLGLRGLL